VVLNKRKVFGEVLKTFDKNLFIIMIMIIIFEKTGLKESKSKINQINKNKNQPWNDFG